MSQTKKTKNTGHSALVENIRVAPLFFKDERRTIPLKEVARVLGMRTRKLRDYAIAGTIPGAMQLGPGKEWLFERYRLEAWWQEYNQQLNRLAKK